MSAEDWQTLPPRTKSEEELFREGWSRRFVGGPPRLQEFVAMYESLGFDVHLEPQPLEELRAECGDCYLALKLFRVVYTRAKPYAHDREGVR
jgi:hypothetical protein